MSNANDLPVVTAEFSGAGKLFGTPGEARREIRADGKLWLIFGDEPKPKPEIKASATQEVAIEASGDFIAEGMLTDSEQMELNEHDSVVVGLAVYTYWKTDRQGLRWLRRVDAGAAEMEHEAEADDEGLEADDEPNVIQEILSDPENEGLREAVQEYLEHSDD